MRCEVDINESDIAKVKMGTPATVIPDAYPDNPFPAQVVKIYPEADRQKGTVKVEVKVLQPDGSARGEISAELTECAGRIIMERPINHFFSPFLSAQGRETRTLWGGNS